MDGETVHDLGMALELRRLQALVQVFAQRMYQKLAAAARDGRAGWDQPGAVFGMRRDVWNCLSRGDHENTDTANLLALLLWHTDPTFRAEVDALELIWDQAAGGQP